MSASPFYLPLVGEPKAGRRYINLPPRSGTYRRWRTFLADSHYGIKILKLQKCEDCHPQQSRDNHTVRARIACFQCHGDEPIAGINHFFSSMNSARRHSYVCAKCHEGANNSYATYVVHAPNPAAAATRDSFPMLFYAFWLMVAVAAGTFAVFLPHTFMWGYRDLMISHKEKDGRRIRRFSIVSTVVPLPVDALFSDPSGYRPFTNVYRDAVGTVVGRFFRRVPMGADDP